MKHIVIDDELNSVLETCASVADLSINDFVRKLVGLAAQEGHPRDDFVGGIKVSAPIQNNTKKCTATTSFPWMAQINAGSDLFRLATRLNRCLEQVAPATRFERGKSGKYIAYPANFVTIKPQHQARNFRVSVYGPFRSNSRDARALGLRISRPPYEEFLFRAESLDESVMNVLKEALSNKLKK